MLERQVGLMSVLFRLLIAAVVLGFVALCIYGWTMPDDEEEDASVDSAPVPAS